ncbi:VOC family protein [Nocardia sp. NPDC051030]|uniref:VOC family protein n=1 Tax=Nocardia sp. NPDC051030 TaxID=3155162 RepID=UPI00341C9619
MTAFIPGAPCWFDVTTPDIPAAAEFYCALFGWTAEDQGAEAGHYTMLRQDGAQVAGIVSAATPDGGQKPSIWLPYFTVADAKATATAAVDAGATVYIEPTDVFGRLEFAILADPDGAAYGITHPITDPGSERIGQPGNPIWIEYTTPRNPADAMAHYAEVFDWDVRNAAWETATENPYQALSLPGRGEFGGSHIAAPGEPAPKWSVTIHAHDSDAIAARAVELGGSIVSAPQDFPGPSRVGVIADPFGATLGLMAFPH